MPVCFLGVFTVTDSLLKIFGLKVLKLTHRHAAVPMTTWKITIFA
ncbi:hypothetical protein D3OALGA1CA_5097 [Olavius algarvensis associated proteobacterium Delta 3]|nr:hypothetical protein D3OALGA1CA_5097 [Olavius algarvensis associated proteobacterium Delta 3]